MWYSQIEVSRSLKKSKGKDKEEIKLFMAFRRKAKKSLLRSLGKRLVFMNWFFHDAWCFHLAWWASFIKQIRKVHYYWWHAIERITYYKGFLYIHCCGVAVGEADTVSFVSASASYSRRANRRYSTPDMSNTTFFYPNTNTNTQYFQRGLNNTQYQYFQKSLTIPIQIPKSVKHPNINTQYFQRGLNNTQYQYQFLKEALTIPNTNTNFHERS